MPPREFSSLFTRFEANKFLSFVVKTFYNLWNRSPELLITLRAENFLSIIISLFHVRLFFWMDGVSRERERGKGGYKNDYLCINVGFCTHKFFSLSRLIIEFQELLSILLQFQFLWPLFYTFAIFILLWILLLLEYFNHGNF